MGRWGVNHGRWFLNLPWLFLAYFMSRFFGFSVQVSGKKSTRPDTRHLKPQQGPETFFTNGFDLHPGRCEGNEGE